MHEGRLVMIAGDKPIIHWDLNWRYKLVIYNNSNFPAFNVKIESIGEVHFEFESLAKINNLAPLADMGLKVKFNDSIESSHIEADKLMQQRFPKKFENLVLKLTSYDEVRNVHNAYVNFTETEVINTKGEEQSGGMKANYSRN